MTDEVVLAPRFGLPLAVVVLGVAVLPLAWLWAPVLWVGLIVILFGLFLLLQSALLRLVFTADALLVQRQATLLRRFPYSEWLGWKLFWPAVPALFYFREQTSIHLLPVLFDASELRHQLETRLPQLRTTD
jgi:hypothetical protein